MTTRFSYMEYAMDVAMIDWKDSKFEKDVLYEDFSAPQWIDFSQDVAHVDDEAWFCRPDGKDDEWCEDELSWNGSDGEPDPSSDLDREWQRRKKQFHSIGYRDGLIAGKEAPAQEGFNVGSKESVVVGYDWGLVGGVTGALNCLPGELREKIIESQETKTKFRHLYESMNNLSTTDALKLYNDDLSIRRVRENKQNSDGSVLDSYHQQLHSLVIESPAIKVQFRDKSIADLSTGKDPSVE